MPAGMRESTIMEQANTLARDPATMLSSRRILLVEDTRDNQVLYSHVLRRAGATVEIAENGRAGVDLIARAIETCAPFDLVLMDMQMPVMDGYEATRCLRARGYGGRIVALTAHAMSGDREMCLEAGCDDYATKPIDRGSLVALCAAWAGV